MIGKKNKNTFFDLLHNTKMTAAELASLVEINGVEYVDRWGDWRVALPNEPRDREVLDAALDTIASAATAFSTNDRDWMETFYRSRQDGAHHPLHNFGYDFDEDGQPLLSKSPLQTQEDLLKRMQSELAEARQEIADLKNKLEEISTWTGFDDVDESLVPLELDVALMVYRDAINQFDPSTGRMSNGDKPKEWIEDKVINDYLKGQSGKAKRIAIVANWQKEAGRPAKNQN